MAHNLSFQINKSGDFVSKNEKPWHGFGTILEQVTLKDAMEYGGLGYHVEKSPNIHQMGDFEIISDTSFFHLEDRYQKGPRSSRQSILASSKFRSTGNR